MRALFALIAALAGCGGQLVDSFDACELAAVVEPVEGLPGDVITLLGGPQSAPYDSLVLVDGVRAEVIDVDRSDECADCDLCRAETLSCGGCSDRCGGCVETLTFVVPAVEPGSRPLVLTNAYGTTGALAFQVTGTATLDTGSAPVDSSPTPPTDTGDPLDTGPPIDTGPLVDTGASPLDTGLPTSPTP